MDKKIDKTACNNMTVIKVALRSNEDDEPRHYTQKFTCYEEFVMNQEDECVQRHIEAARKNCFFEPESIVVTSIMEVI